MTNEVEKTTDLCRWSSDPSSTSCFRRGFRHAAYYTASFFAQWLMLGDAQPFGASTIGWVGGQVAALIQKTAAIQSP